MGAGIAQLAAPPARGRCCTTPTPALSAAWTARDGLERWARRGGPGRRRGPLDAAGELEDLAPATRLEAAPERLELKRELFATLARIVAPDAVLATNTSSIPITAIAAGRRRARARRRPALLQPGAAHGARGAHRRAGLVARGARASRGPPPRRWASASSTPPTARASSSTAATARSASRRCACCRSASPTPEQIDRICRLGGGFRMGPFELQDLVGLDVGFEVAELLRRAELRRAALAARRRSRRAMVAAGGIGPQERAAAGTPTRRRPPPRRRPAAAARPAAATAGSSSSPATLPGRARAARRAPRRPAGTRAAGGGRGRGAVPDPRLRRRPRGRPAAAGRRRRRCSAPTARSPRSDPGGAAAGFHVLPPLGTAGSSS